MITTWTDLERSIRAAGAVNVAQVREIAIMLADREMRAWADIGIKRSWDACLAEAMALAWCRAHTILDNEIAQRIRAGLPAAEQLARTADLNAEIAEASIPPRPVEARKWRAEAAACRRAKFRVVK